MSAPFVTQLRARPGVIRLGTDSKHRMVIRVQLAEAWDMVRVDTSSSEPVAVVKSSALAALRPGEPVDAFIVKLNGFEVLDESVPVGESGATSGSTFLLSYRRRRPVR